MDKESTLSELERLRDEAYGLRDKPPLSGEFHRWNTQALETVTQICGPNSEEAKHLQKIRFKIGGVRRFERKVQTAIEKELQETHNIEKLQANYYRQALSDAAELLQSIIMKLRDQ